MGRDDWPAQVRANLTWLDNNYSTIQAHLAPGAGIRSDIHTKPGSRPPLNTQALNLIQRGGIAGQLTPWAELIVEERHVDPVPHRLADEPYFHATVALLHRHLDWANDQDWFPDLRTEIFQLRRDVEWTCGLINESPIPGDRKTCPLDRDLPDGTVTPCNGRLIQDHDHDTIYCRTCKTTWDSSQWLHLGRLLREMEATA